MTAVEAEQACLENMRTAVGAWDGYWAVHGAGFHVHEHPMVGKPYEGRLEALHFHPYTFEVGGAFSVEAIAEQMFVLRENGLVRLGEMPMKIYCA
jgi:hypothetical protein